MDRRRASGIALVLVSAAGFGSGSLFAQPVYGAGVGWLVLSAWRFLFGAALTWGWLLLSAERRRGLRMLDRRAVIAAVALGLLYLGNSGTYFAGLETVSPSLAALIVYLYPALVAVLTFRIGRRLHGRRAWMALAIALAGVVLAVGGIDPSVAPPLGGLLLILASPIIYAVWIVLSARLSGERPDAVGDDASGGAVGHGRDGPDDVGDGGRLLDHRARQPPGRPADRGTRSGLVRPVRCGRDVDLHRDPDVLCRGAADRCRAGRADQHGRADLDDRRSPRPCSAWRSPRYSLPAAR